MSPSYVTFEYLSRFQFIGFVTVAALFWTDIIPSLGNANSIYRLGRHLRNGILCHYGNKPDCQALPISVVFVIGKVSLDPPFLCMRERGGDGVF